MAVAVGSGVFVAVGKGVGVAVGGEGVSVGGIVAVAVGTAAPTATSAGLLWPWQLMRKRTGMKRRTMRAARGRDEGLNVMVMLLWG